MRVSLSCVISKERMKDILSLRASFSIMNLLSWATCKLYFMWPISGPRSLLSQLWFSMNESLQTWDFSKRLRWHSRQSTRLTISPFQRHMKTSNLPTKRSMRSSFRYLLILLKSMSLSLPWLTWSQRAKRRISANIKASLLIITQMIMTSVRLSWGTLMEIISIWLEVKMENQSVVCSSTSISTTTSIKAPNQLFWRQTKKVLFIWED